MGPVGTALAQQHLRNILAYLDVPTLGQPEAFIHAKEGLFDGAGDIAEASKKFAGLGRQVRCICTPASGRRPVAQASGGERNFRLVGGR